MIIFDLLKWILFINHIIVMVSSNYDSAQNHCHKCSNSNYCQYYPNYDIRSSRVDQYPSNDFKSDETKVRNYCSGSLTVTDPYPNNTINQIEIMESIIQTSMNNLNVNQTNFHNDSFYNITFNFDCELWTWLNYSHIIHLIDFYGDYIGNKNSNGGTMKMRQISIKKPMILDIQSGSINIDSGTIEIKYLTQSMEIGVNRILMDWISNSTYTSHWRYHYLNHYSIHCDGGNHTNYEANVDRSARSNDKVKSHVYR
jgi:hypothetical protein